MAIIPPQRKSISQVKAQLLNPATTSHFQMSVSFQSREFNRFKQEVGLNLDQGRLNILCSDASLPGSSFATAELTNNIPGVRERHVYRRTYDDNIQLSFYCDADQYLPIRFFEAWMNFITNTTNRDDPEFKNADDPAHFYRVKFPKRPFKPLFVKSVPKIELALTFLNFIPGSICLDTSMTPPMVFEPNIKASGPRMTCILL